MRAAGMEGEAMNTEQVLDAYRDGDEDKRLSLFLGYRELRDEFSRIEQEQEVIQLPEKGAVTWLKRVAAFL